MSASLRDPDSPAREAVAEASSDFVVFDVAGETFAMPTLDVERVAELGDVVPIPLSPDYVMGVTLIDGQLVAVADLPALLGARNTWHDARRVLLLRRDGFVVGIAIERLHRLVTVPLSQVGQPISDEAAKASGRLRRGLVHVDDKHIDVIDARIIIDKLVGTGDTE